MKLTIVVPCYNEAENIPLIVKRFSEIIGDRNIEVILVNNGSTDNSAEILEQELKECSFAKTVLVPVNQGYGYGILKGLEVADGDYIGWTHADMQTDPKDIAKAYDLIVNQKEQVYIKGNRKGRPWMDNLFTNGMSLFETIYFWTPMHDINAQPNIFPKEFFQKWENPPHDFALDLYACYFAKKKNLKMLRFPVQFPERIHGQSKWNTGLGAKWKFIKRTMAFSVELKKRLK